MQPLVNTCMTTLSEGSDAFPFLCSMLPRLHPKSFDNEEKGKKLWNWATTSPCWRLKKTQGVFCYRSYTIVSGGVGHGCWPLYLWNWENISTIWEKQKQIKRETGLGFALPCTRSVFILFYFIVGLLFSIYLFIFFHSPFMNSGLGSEGNHAYGHITPPPEFSRSTSRGCWEGAVVN